MSAPPPVPLATYRLQFNRDFTFEHATRLVPYLHALGVSHVYASSYLKARPGSTHGYDIIDHNALNPEIGTPDDFARFCRALKERGMGQVLDFVPNHMGVGKTDNAWWLDVLEMGRGIAVRGLLRHRLDGLAPQLRRQGAAAGAGRPVRRGAGAGRAEALLRFRPKASASAISTTASRSARATTRRSSAGA